MDWSEGGGKKNYHITGLFDGRIEVEVIKFHFFSRDIRHWKKLKVMADGSLFYIFAHESDPEKVCDKYHKI